MSRTAGEFRAVTYSGSGPYCYSNALAMTLGHPVDAPLIEAITGSAYGYQRIGEFPLFDPPGWDPDKGIDQALGIMGVENQRRTFTDEKEALATLRRLANQGPVFVGPLDMGLLRHQGRSDRPTGADHFVAVLDVNDERVVMHDPQGHPYAALPVRDFMKAWGSDSIGYAEGRFPLRTGFTKPVGTAAQWAAGSLPQALNWAQGAEAIPGFPSGNEDGLRELSEEATTRGLSFVTTAVLLDFSLRLGARRRSDTADLLRDYPELASLLARQAAVIGGAQISVIDSDWVSLARRLDDASALHSEIVEELRKLA